MKKFVFALVLGVGLFAGGSVTFAAEQTHVVQPGDTLYGLANEYGTTIDNLVQLNPAIKDANLIYDGETLIIAADSAADESAATTAATVPATAATSSTTSSQTMTSIPASGSGVLNPVDGVNYYNGVRETYYSQKVLPGGGLNIPGRHVASDGTIRDSDGYIVAASDLQAKGATGQSSLGTYKVYDTGVGHAGIDIYTNW